jgi:hypothetical protein
MRMTISEKVLANHAGAQKVSPCDIVTVVEDMPDNTALIVFPINCN